MRIHISARSCVRGSRRSSNSCCFSVLFFLLLLLVCNTNDMLLVVAIKSEHGGANHSKSLVERQLAGIQEAVRWITEPLLMQKRQRLSTKVTIANVGFGRTGTTSLEAALKILDLTPLQDDVIWEVSDLFTGYYQNQISMNQFVDGIGERGFDYMYFYDIEFYKWLANNSVSGDTTTTTNNNKNIKVLMTVRDSPQVWAKSYLAVADFGRAFFQPPFVWLPSVQDMLSTLEATEHYHTNFAPRELYKDIPTLEAAYQHHVETIQSIIPSERLLVFNVKEGWEPLCTFLDRPIPNVPFPHINDRVVISALVGTLWAIVYLWLILVAMMLWLIWKICLWAIRNLHRPVIIRRPSPKNNGLKEKES